MFPLLLLHSVPTLQQPAPDSFDLTTARMVQAGDWVGLEALARKALEADRKDARAWAALGSALLNRGQGKEGRQALEEAERLDPNNVRALYYLGILHAVNKDRPATLATLGRLAGSSFAAAHALSRLPEIENLLTDGLVQNIDFAKVRILNQPMAPPYPFKAKLARIQGTVVVELTVDRTGIPVSVQAVEGPEELRETAEIYAIGWTFQPWKDPGIPLYRFKLTMPFRLR